MNTPYVDPIDDPEEIPSLPAGELPDVDQLPPTEPSGPPASSAAPFATTAVPPLPATLRPLEAPGT